MRLPRLIEFPFDFEDRWERWYGDVPPIGFLLREAFPDRWLRIHSLPEGRRQPESGFDYAEVLRRHKRVAAEVLDDGSECTVLISAPCHSAPSELSAAAGLHGIELARVQLSPELSDSQDGIFDVPMCVFGIAAYWNGDDLAALISAVAEDRTRALIAELSRGRVYAPYAGGADLFFTNEAERDAARTRLAHWLSARADGL